MAITLKVCAKCGESKPATAFGKRHKGRHSAHTELGR